MRFLKRIVSLSLLLIPLFGFANLNSVALFYSDNPPIDQLRAYDVAVVEPSSGLNPNTYRTPSSEPFAYVSVGEVSPDDTYYKEIPKSWLVGNNTIWKAKVIDQSNPAWQQFFMDQIITPLWDKGYHGFLLDTLDSYQLVAHDPKSQQKQIDGLVTLIKAIKTRYPDAKIILNRGFEFLPQIQNLVYAVAAESLYGGWDEQKKRYVPVAPQDRTELLTELQKVQKMGLPVIVIDYMPPRDRAGMQRVADKISKLGFIPWVADGELSQMGIGNIKVAPRINGVAIPRQVLIVYDTKIDTTLTDTSPFLLIAMPLEYLGYVPKWQNVSKPLPPGNLSGRYAGIIVWLSQEQTDTQPMQAWVQKQIGSGIPIVFFENFGGPMQNEYLQSLGVSVQQELNTDQPLQIISKDPMVGFEIQPPLNPYDFAPVRTQQGKVLLQVKNAKGQLEDAIAITPWGGYALDPFVYLGLPDTNSFWILNPLKFLSAALRLPMMPVPDATTENGRRLMMIQVDGDSFSQKAEWINGSYAAVELKNRILNKYQVPTTVSVIEGEIGPDGIYPRISPELMEIAREIFALPWVEIASHTFSHPFDWVAITSPEGGNVYNLPIPNYKFNVNREITGSMNFINNKLAPPGKRCKVLLWSGNANPQVDAIALTYKDGLYNFNGGNTVITTRHKSITDISPLGVDVDGYFQVFAQTHNENLYTNSWMGPFYGFKDVIQTFQLTDSPLRFKPIDIYYHFYSAAKLASLGALDTVYQWALSQPVLNVYISEYAQKVLDFNRIDIASYKGGWVFHSNGYLRELRAPKLLGYPDLQKSQNLIGFNDHDQDYYLHLGPDKQSLIYFTNKAPSLPYLANANGFVTAFKRTAKGMKLALTSHLPLQFVIANMKNCKINSSESVKIVSNTNGIIDYKLNKDSDEFTISC